MKVITDNWDSLDTILYNFAAGLAGKQSTIDSSHPIDGTEVKLGTYSKATSKEDIAVNDTVKTALGKVEKRVEDNENNISYTTNQGVKNLFNLTKASGTYNTVIFTVNDDKTVTVNGTASPSNSVFYLDDWTCTKAGTYVVSGAPSGGSWAPSPDTYRIRVAVNGTWKGDDVGNGFALTLAVGDVINLQINTSTSYTANNLVFKPMISIKSLYDADPTYQSYALSNADLSESVLKLQERFIDCQFIASRADYTEHTFTVKRSNTIGRYHYGIFMVGTPSTYGIYKIFYDDANTPASATVERILGNSALTYTATIAWNGLDGTLTLTGSDRAYGGIRGIWFD